MRRLLWIISKLCVVLFCAVLIVYILVQTRTLLYPLVLAILFSYLLYPVGKWLEQKGFHRILANFLVIVGSFALISLVVYILYVQVHMLVDDLPELKEQAQKNITQVTESVSAKIGVSTSKFKEWSNTQLNSLYENSGFFFSTIFPSTASTLVAFGILPVYVFMLLFYRNKFHAFLLMVWPQEKRAKLNDVITKISSVTKKYVGGVFTVVAILCVLNSVGLMIVGVKYAILLGILSAICNFIPYFGTLIGALFPLIMAFFTGESPNETLGVIILFVIIQFTENNILTPNITGGSVQVNPLVTIVSIIAAGMVWGIPGMFVIIPFLGMVKIVLESNESTKPLAFLLGTDGTEKHSITIKKIKTFFTFKKK